MSLVQIQAHPPMLFVPRIVKTSALKLTRDKGYVLNKYLLHSFPKGYPQVQTVIIFKNKVAPSDIAISKRLLKAYKLAVSFSNPKEHKPALPAGRDIWTDLARAQHREFIEVLKADDPKVLAEYLLHMHARGISQGLMQGEIEYKKMRTSKIFRRFLGVNTKDKLVALAEYLDILPYENPEQGRYGENIYENENRLVSQIENKLGFKITTSDFENGLLKLKLRSGSLHARDIYSLYTAIRLFEIVGKTAKVAEIGGGLGRSAYYSYKLGIRDYSIFDLPYINVLQGYFLLKALPKGSVSLYGEKPSKVKILPDHEFSKAKRNQFDITLNADSFPEINIKIFKKYLKDIKVNTKKYFLSINQEGESDFSSIKQAIVSRVILDVGGFRKEYRFPFWVRKGYVEELYSIIRG